MNQTNLFIELTRLKRPIGYMLLFWPCVWGLTIAFDFNKEFYIYSKYFNKNATDSQKINSGRMAIIFSLCTALLKHGFLKDVRGCS